MSRRFGRNQKRALRTELTIAQGNADKFQYAYELADGINKHQNHLVREQTDALQRIARVLGPNFYGLAPIKRRLDHLGNSFQLPKMRDPIEFLDNRELPEMVAYAVEQLQAVQAKVRRDQITGAVHILLETPDGRRTYAVSASAWAQMKRDRRYMAEVLVKEIGQAMAEYITREKA